MKRLSLPPFLRRLALPLVLSCLVLLLLLQAVDLTGFRNALQGADPALLCIAALNVPLTYLILMLRWHKILAAGGFLVSRGDLTAAVMVGSFFNNVTPGLKVGGDPLKAYYLTRKYGFDFTTLMAGVVTERTLQGVTLVLTGTVVLLVSVILQLPISSVQAVSVFMTMTAALVGGLIYIAVYRAEPLIRAVGRALEPLTVTRGVSPTLAPDHMKRKAGAFHRGYVSLLRKIPVVAAVTGLTVLQLAVESAQAFIIFRALHSDIPVGHVILGTIVVKVFSVVGITPGGAGVAEGVNFGVYAILWPIPGEVIAAQTLLSRALGTWLGWISSGIVASLVAPGLVESARGGAGHEPPPIE